MDKRKKKTKKDCCLEFRITQADKERIKFLAQKAGLSVSEYLIRCALRRKLPLVDADTQYYLMQLSYSLKKIGNNFNQLTQTCHISRQLGEPVVVDTHLLTQLSISINNILTLLKQINETNQN